MDRTARLVVILCLSFASASGAAELPSDASSAVVRERSELEALEDRVRQLEALVVQLQERLGPTAADEPAADAPTVGENSPASEERTRRAVEVASVDRSAGSPNAVTGGDAQASMEWASSSYWPSRGWNASWLQAVDLPIELRAYFDLELIDAGPDGSRGGVSTFDNHHVQVFLDGRLSRRVTTHVELEWEHGGDVVEVDSAFVDLDLRPEVQVRIGRFYAPFGIERFVGYSPTNALVSRPDVFREIVPNNFYSDGVMLYGSRALGESSRLAWEASISNGLGTDALESRRGSRQTRDDNSNRAVTGRLGWVFMPRIELGASAHHQRYSADDAGEDLDLRFLGLDLAWRWQGFELRSEKVWTEIDRFEAPALEEEGWYGQLAYLLSWERRWLPALLLAARAETLDFEPSTTEDDLDILSLGVNATLIEHFRLKAEYQWRDQADLDADRWLFQAVVDF